MTDGLQQISRLFFHHHAHEAWSQRRMEFWFLAAESTYSRDEAKRALRAVADELGLATYATYELIGNYDLLVRLYLHPWDQEAFEDALARHLGTRARLAFRVARVVRHWVWAKGPAETGGVVEPDKDVLAQWYPRTELDLLGRHEDGSATRDALIDTYAALDLVRRAARTPGIKLIVKLSFPERLSEAQRRTVTRELARLLDERRDVLSERSLYLGDATQLDQFLIMCRVERRDFHAIRERLIEPIGRAVGGTVVRTETYPVVSDDFVCFSERIAVDEPEPTDLLALLQQGGEQQEFEVKGSCFAPLHPWLIDGEPLQEAASFPFSSVLKAIVGMLNGTGGTVLVGAVETAAFAKHPRALETLAKSPSVMGMGDEFAIIGLVDPIFVDHGWDAWRSRLDALIASHIDPAPGVLVEVLPDQLESQQVARITIDEPRETQVYRLRETRGEPIYYARIGGRTEKLSGSEIELHRGQLRDRRRSRRSGGHGRGR